MTLPARVAGPPRLAMCLVTELDRLLAKSCGSPYDIATDWVFAAHAYVRLDDGANVMRQATRLLARMIGLGSSVSAVNATTVRGDGCDRHGR